MESKLIINSLKHAFNQKKGEVTVHLSKNEKNQYKFTYKDNGVGMDLIKIDKSTNSLGLKLIKMLAEEIDASIQVESNNGLTYIFNFKIK
ncbi:MAG: ATP-binding protein [Polaribacter sp.]|uniref:ATP-binding protein n=1 Tax=Polaribacter sp. TaxID=1920175 RepID=UPI002F35B784